MRLVLRGGGFGQKLGSMMEEDMPRSKKLLCPSERRGPLLAKNARSLWKLRLELV